MRGDIPAPAFRLSCTLPCTTHERRTPQQQRSPDHIGVGKGGNQGRKLLLNGKEYANMTVARRACGISYSTIYKWIAEGKARYL